MSTMQEKVRMMSKQVNAMLEEERVSHKKHCLSLLCDVVKFTDDRLDEMDKSSLAGYMELAAFAMHCPNPPFADIRKSLIELGFNTVPPGSLN